MPGQLLPSMVERSRKVSKDAEFLPRVIFETSENSSSLHINFKLSTSGATDIPDGLQDLFSALEDWTAHCIASIQHMPVLSSIGHYVVDKEVHTKLLKYLKGESISYEEIDLDEKGGKRRYSFILHDDDVNYVAAELSQTTHMIKAARAIQRSNLSALVAEFDYLVFRSLNAVCRDFPQFVVPDDEKVDVGYLRSGRSFVDWQSERVQKAVERKLFESHSDIIKWILTDIAKLQDGSAVEKSPFFKDFIEVCQRRHLLIHNGGIVNSEYVRKCVEAGISRESLPRIGDQLDVDVEYLRRAAARVYLVGAFTMFLVAQRVYPSHNNVAYRMLLSASHDFLLAGMTKLAERIIDFAEYNSKNFDNDLKLKFAINKALSKLLDPGLDRDNQTELAKKVLDRYDWSVTTPIFDLALACVKREFSNVIPLARAASAAGLSYREVRSFVVFKEARDIDGFMECFPKTMLLIEKST